VAVLNPQIDLDRDVGVHRDSRKVLLVLLQSGSISHRVSGLLREGRAFCAGHMRISGISKNVVITVARVMENELAVGVGCGGRDAHRASTINQQLDCD
jgi:hypothetical protein